MKRMRKLAAVLLAGCLVAGSAQIVMAGEIDPERAIAAESEEAAIEVIPEESASVCQLKQHGSGIDFSCA